jgi:very-short-patch-repair endonuclease
LKKHEDVCDGQPRYQQGVVNGDENIDWVACKMCSFKGRALAKHISQVHKLDVISYQDRFPGSLINCSSSKERFKDRGSENFNWINRAKERGDDLSEYKKKLGNSVRRSILENPEERLRRSEQLAKNNRTTDARKRSSEVAKKTSSRPEILKERTDRLSNWRNENFDVFYEKFVKGSQSRWISKPEKILTKILTELEGFSFKQNQVVKSEKFLNKSNRKQIDIADKGARIYIEFDGIYHFKPINGQEKLDKAKLSDKQLDAHIEHHGWTLIRISFDQFSYKSGGKFSIECIERLFEILKDPAPGVYRIGEAYSSFLPLGVEEKEFQIK